jgi:hypothetical protein
MTSTTKLHLLVFAGLLFSDAIMLAAVWVR